MQTFVNICLRRILGLWPETTRKEHLWQLHVRCRLNRRFDRDAGYGSVILSESQSIAFHGEPWPGTQWGNGKEDDWKTSGAMIWKQTSKKRDTIGDNWRNWQWTRMPGGIVSAAYVREQGWRRPWVIEVNWIWRSAAFSFGWFDAYCFWTESNTPSENFTPRHQCFHIALGANLLFCMFWLMVFFSFVVQVSFYPADQLQVSFNILCFFVPFGPVV